MALIYLFIIMSTFALIGIIASCVYIYKYRDEEDDDK